MVTEHEINKAFSSLKTSLELQFQTERMLLDVNESDRAEILIRLAADRQRVLLAELEIHRCLSLLRLMGIMGNLPDLPPLGEILGKFTGGAGDFGFASRGHADVQWDDLGKPSSDSG